MPTPTIADRVRQAFGIDLDNFSGGSLAGEVPLTDAVINDVIAERLAASQGPVAAAHVQAHEGQQLTIQLSMRGPRLMPSVKIAARIEQQPQCPHPAVLGLRWSMPGLGPLALFAAPALAHFKALPAGIRVEGDRMTIDIGELLAARGLGDLVSYLAGLRVTTRNGLIVVQFEARIP